MQKLIDAYMLKYDVLNTKAALESITTGKKASLIPLGKMYRSEWLSDLGHVQDVIWIVNILKNSGLPDYAEVLLGFNPGGKSSERFRIETALDKKYYENLLKIARKTPDHDDLIKGFGTMIDLRNLKILLRGAARGAGESVVSSTVGAGYLISDEDIQELAATRFEDFPGKAPYAYQDIVQEVVASYGKNKNITAVEDIIDRSEYRLLRETLSLKLMSPVMIVWYLILKETEVRNLRLVLRALFDNVPIEEIRDYLVMTV